MEPTNTTGDSPQLVAVTSCPTGIAHTYMAADSLEQAAEKAGARIQVETQGSSGTSEIDQATIDEAVAVIFATNLDVKGEHRFAGKPVVRSGVKRAIDDPESLVSEALEAAQDPDAERVESDGGAADGSASGDEDDSLGGQVRGWLKSKLDR